MPDQRSYGTHTEVDDDLTLRREQLRAVHDLVHEQNDSWAVDPNLDPRHLPDRDLIASIRTRHGGEALYHADGGILHVNAGHGHLSVSAYAHQIDLLDGIVSVARDAFPVHNPDDPDRISVTFWTASPRGPISRLRMLDAPSWETIEANYPAARNLDIMMSGEFAPGVGGQLLLWHGDPGTGKTTALRALGREWRDWCELHYIVDPEQFFGADAAYMMQVMLGGDLAEIADEEGDTPKWRLLVLEDCGEMLQPDARKEVGQALSRLLNACDGLIGQGLRLLLLVTTNEPLDKLHDAVARPGRCAMNIEFERFSAEQAAEWVSAHGFEPERTYAHRRTLADLYGEIARFHTRERAREVGFR